jgi:hypothetical protein
MPDELAFDLDDHEIEIIKLTKGARRPVFGELAEFILKIDLVIHEFFAPQLNAVSIIPC